MRGHTKRKSKERNNQQRQNENKKRTEPKDSGRKRGGCIEKLKSSVKTEVLCLVYLLHTISIDHILFQLITYNFNLLYAISIYYILFQLITYYFN